MDQEDEEIYDPGEKTLALDIREKTHVSSKNDRGILPELAAYKYSEEIKSKADEIYRKMTYKVCRGNVRIKKLFYCVYCAHLELGINTDPMKIGSDFGLDESAVQKTYSLFGALQTGYQPPTINMKPSDYLKDYCEAMGLSTEIQQDMIEWSKTILNKDPSLLQESPKTVSTGIFKYYLYSIGIQPDPAEMTRITQRSVVTTDNIFRKISEIDNRSDL